MKYLLLLLSHAVIYVLNGLFTISTSITDIIISMNQVKVELETRVDNDFVIELNFVAIRVTNRDILNHRARIGTGENETDFTNGAVKNTTRTLDQFVSPNREHVDVAVPNQASCVESLARRVEESVLVDAVISVLEIGMTKDVFGISMAMLPNERNSRLILMLESTRHDGPTVRAL